LVRGVGDADELAAAGREGAAEGHAQAGGVAGVADELAEVVGAAHHHAPGVGAGLSASHCSITSLSARRAASSTVPSMRASTASLAESIRHSASRRPFTKARTR